MIKKRKIDKNFTRVIETLDDFRVNFLDKLSLMKDPFSLDYIINEGKVKNDDLSQTHELVISSQGSRKRMEQRLSEKLIKDEVFRKKVMDLFFEYFHKPHLMESQTWSSSFHDEEWILNVLIRYFFTGTWHANLRELYSKYRREEERVVIGNNNQLDTYHVRLCGTDVPVDVFTKILGYLPRNKMRINVGCVSEQLLFIILSTWKRVALRTSKIFSISLVTLKYAQEIVFMTLLTKEETDFLERNISFDRITLIDHSRMDLRWDTWRFVFPLHRRNIKSLENCRTFVFHRSNDPQRCVCDYSIFECPILGNDEVIGGCGGMSAVAETILNSTSNVSSATSDVCEGNPIFPNVRKIVDMIPRNYKHFCESRLLRDLGLRIGSLQKMTNLPQKFLKMLEKITTLRLVLAKTRVYGSMFKREHQFDQKNVEVIEEIGKRWCSENLETLHVTFLHTASKENILDLNILIDDNSYSNLKTLKLSHRFPYANFRYGLANFDGRRWVCGKNSFRGLKMDRRVDLFEWDLIPLFVKLQSDFIAVTLEQVYAKKFVLSFVLTMDKVCPHYNHFHNGYKVFVDSFDVVTFLKMASGQVGYGKNGVKKNIFRRFDDWEVEVDVRARCGRKFPFLLIKSNKEQGGWNIQIDLEGDEIPTLSSYLKQLLSSLGEFSDINSIRIMSMMDVEDDLMIFDQRKRILSENLMEKKNTVLITTVSRCECSDGLSYPFNFIMESKETEEMIPNEYQDLCTNFPYVPDFSDEES